MCGLTGFWQPGGFSAPDAEAMATVMAQRIAHRGPDSGGIWVDAATGIALGHRRLSILDLSSEGHQPMLSACGRYVISFNGEIYNFKTLRRELENTGGTFRGHSDTEVMLAAISQWGLEKALQQFNGMFAFALWDREERRLHLVRDRLGEKPLYYGWMGKTFLFGSELKALRAHPNFLPEINRNAIALFLRHNYIPAPYSIYQGIYKLLPGTYLTIRRTDIGRAPVPIPYWSVKEAAERGVANPFRGRVEEAVAQLETLLQDAAKLRMEADVPLGAFLSGGIDSSTVVALMQAQSPRPVKTFTIGFHEGAYNEATHAKAVAKHLGTDHTALYVTPAEAMAVIPRLPVLYDEPFSDSSQIPTFLVSQLARQHVTVSLSGDGGDELFGGYNRYFLGRDIWGKIGWMPRGARHIAARALTAISSQKWDQVLSLFGPLLPSKLKQRTSGDNLYKLASILDIENPEAMYLRLISHWKDPATLVVGASEPPTALTDSSRHAKLSNFTQQMMYLDAVTYLPDDILAKVDRASMGVSLEARVPFLDHRLVEFAWRIPLSMNIRNGKGKWLLRQILHKYVPEQLIERPKMGFGVPIDAWLRGPLREWAEALLGESRLKQEGFLHPEPIRQKWREHLSGAYNWQYYLWDVLMFQAWLAHWKQRS